MKTECQWKPGPAKTRGGHDVIIYTTSGRGPYPIKGAVRFEEHDDVRSWTIDGRQFQSSRISGEMDLAPSLPETREVWVNVYPATVGMWCGLPFKDRDSADALAEPGRIGCHRITMRAEFEEE